LSDIISGEGFWPFWLRLPGPGPKLLVGSISLKFVFQSTLEFKSLEAMTDFLGFRVQKLWPENKIIT